MEAAPHNLVHRVMGLEGDLGAPETAARDPIFWLHHANVDRLWAKWTDPARGRIPPIDDEVWMTTKFTFVDEDGQDRVMTGAEVLDTQFQLGYRYDDDPRGRSVWTERSGGDGARRRAAAAAGYRRAAAARPRPVVLARAGAMRLTARESQVALDRQSSRPAARRCRAARPRPAARARLRVVLRNVIANEQSPPYDVFLALEGGPRVPDGRIGAARRARSVRRRRRARRRERIAMASRSSHSTRASAVAELVAHARLRHATICGCRWCGGVLPFPTGGEFVPPDPDPPRIGAIELIQS